MRLHCKLDSRLRNLSRQTAVKVLQLRLPDLLPGKKALRYLLRYSKHGGQRPLFCDVAALWAGIWLAECVNH